jgi:tRNA-specific 2-thiouridylase
MRVVVAMSGGVDSSVAAGLLAAEGHEVIGVTLQLYDHGAAQGRKGACCAGQDIRDAKRVADRLGIPHYVIDAEETFRRSVIGPFADSYAAGETPVPCIACNQHLKFGELLQMARELGAEALATGHYVRRVEGEAGVELHRAADEARDQSWFLFATTREQLAYCRFPLGDFASKAEVRREALRLGLAVAEKPDSQDICFIPGGSYAELVGRLRPDALTEGEIVSEDGARLGQHQGIARYTIGQAKRLGGAMAADGQALVVRRIEPGARRIVVGPRHTGSCQVRLREVNWLIGQPPVRFRAEVKLRARQELQVAEIEVIDESVCLHLEQPVLAAPGQAAVFYAGSRVLGGGYITA